MDSSPDVEQKVAETIQLLVALQQLDDKLAALEERREAGPARLRRTEDQLQAARALADGKHQQLQEAQTGSDKKELEVKVCEEHIRRLELQRTNVRKNEEYKALTETIGAERERSSRLEEETLELLTEVDGHRAEYEERQREVKRLDEELARVKAEVHAEAAQIAQEGGSLVKERNALASRADAAALGKYERIRKGRGGRGIIPVINGVCQGCSMGVTDQTLNRLILRKEMVFCERCSRILYLPEDSISELVHGPESG